MVVHWLHNREKGWWLKAIVNGLGAAVTFVTLGIISYSKFAQGAWISILLIIFMIYIFTAFIFTLLLAFSCEMSPLTAITASITCLSNVGPAFGALSPDCTFAWLTPSAKLLLSLEMLIGRLELYTILIFILPSFWKK
mgnify:CR=1 FL=1